MKLHAPIKGIFFDIGWTLLRDAGQDWFVTNKMMDCVNAQVFKAIAEERNTAAFDRAIKYLDDNHLVLTEDEEFKQFEVFYSMLADDLPELGLTQEQVREIAYAKVYDNNYILFDDTIATLEALHGQYKLGVISDNFPSIERFLRHENLEHLFETKTISCYLGTYKPDQRMYLHALEQMKLPPEQTVFVDDGEENLDGAAILGIQPVQIAGRPNEYSSAKYPYINKLSELLTILPCE